MNEYDRLRKQAEFYKKNYPPGTRIYLNHMDDPYSPVPSGTKGTVTYIDDLGQLGMTWDNGRTLALVPGVDSFRKLTTKELEEEQAKSVGSSRKSDLDSQIRAASHAPASSNLTTAEKHEPER